ncbi:MAG: hypothetical protein QOH25_114 [Acidobacteriota bacterium]|nr:hypothetical protein [Acidobacteriota bacterium]
MYFLNSQRTLCHRIEDMRTGEAPDPCGKKAYKLDILRYQRGELHNLLPEKPKDVPLCKHCQKSQVLAWVE